MNKNMVYDEDLGCCRPKNASEKLIDLKADLDKLARKIRKIMELKGERVSKENDCSSNSDSS